MLIQILQYGFMLSMVGLVGIPLFVVYRQMLAKRYRIKTMRKTISDYPDDHTLVTHAKAELHNAKKRPFWKWNVNF